MIAYIKGELAEILPDSIVVDVSGIGYHIFVPLQVLDEMPQAGEMVKIYTYFQVREDAAVLFGFLKKEDLKLFKLLIGVSGIGPKGALSVLSVMTADDLRFAVLGDDAKAIAKAPGIGAKTAKRLILELKDKVSIDEAFGQSAEQDADTPLSSKKTIKNEAVLALAALGYSSKEALMALNGIEITEHMEVEELLKQALQNMAFL